MDVIVYEKLFVKSRWEKRKYYYGLQRRPGQLMRK